MTLKSEPTRVFHPAPRRSGLPRSAALVLPVFWLVLTATGGAMAQTLSLTSPPAHINDGDTFEADLNGNGRLDLPQERMRLLYVDAPELHESRKGQDLKHGLPAREFLRAALGQPPIFVSSPGRRKFDKFGRRLVVVKAGGKTINLELVRQGHSYFDTRFSFPAAYEAYAAAEGEAFSARRGIWASPASREAYLARLRKEGKTPRSAANPRFLKKVRATDSLRPERWVGRFVMVRGRFVERKVLRRGARKILLQGPPGRKPLQAYVSRRVSGKLPVDEWPVGAELELDGYIRLYRGTPQLALHFGKVVADSKRHTR